LNHDVPLVTNQAKINDEYLITRKVSIVFLFNKLLAEKQRFINYAFVSFRIPLPRKSAVLVRYVNQPNTICY